MIYLFCCIFEALKNIFSSCKLSQIEYIIIIKFTFIDKFNWRILKSHVLSSDGGCLIKYSMNFDISSLYMITHSPNDERQLLLINDEDDVEEVSRSIFFFSFFSSQQREQLLSKEKSEESANEEKYKYL
jgi:hypothetical protein